MDPRLGQVIGGMVPSRRFFAIDGVGGPMSADYDIAGSALRATLAECERRVRRERLAGPTRRVAAETLWWPARGGANGPPDGFVDRSEWHWRQLLEIPDEASDGQIADAIGSGRGSLTRQLDFTEGPVAQWLHIGDSDGEVTSVRRLFGAIAEGGYRPVGPLHVLALVDPRSVPRDRARAIFRQPIA